jgi:hypothetical protein
MCSKASMCATWRVSSRAALRTEVRDARSNAGRFNVITDAPRCLKTSTVAEPIAPRAPVTTTVGCRAAII